MSKTVAILTPAYNRADTLGILFESLKKQTSKDFKWYIIDDGSTDNTPDVCKNFFADDFEIEYIHKTNGGKHTAVNRGLDVIDETLTFIVDSDDFLTDDAVETVVRDWKKYESRPDVGGLCYLKMKPDLQVVGNIFGDGNEFVDGYIDVRLNRGVSGDKAEVFRTDVFKAHRFPVFEGEKFFSEAVVWAAMCRSGFKLAFISKGIYVCEYRSDGLTNAGKAKVFKNPYCYLEHSKMFMHKDIKQKLQWKYSLMYVATGFIADKSIKAVFRECPQKGKFICAFLPGYALYRRWKKKWGN